MNAVRIVFVLIVAMCMPLTAAGDENRGFQFGSYGRVQPAADLRGGAPQDIDVVAHGSRLDEKSYVELDFAYLFKPQNGIEFDFVSTVAFSEKLFHDTGDFNAVNAVRNLFIRARHFLADPLVIWAGSRMYRGDDIYLFDVWPLDDANMYGGGAGWHEKRWRVDLHAGLNRLETDFQRQEIEVPSTDTGTATVTILNRQRVVSGLKGTVFFAGNESSEFGMKAKVFGEFHHIGPGTMVYPDDGDREVRYPADAGYSVGAQLGAFGYGQEDFANLFVRYSGGLAAYGLLTPPWGFNTNRKTTGAREFLTGLSGTWTIWKFATMFGGYIRYFRDADPNRYDNDDRWEYIFSVRPHFMLHEHLYLGMEVSHQILRPAGVYSDRVEKAVPLTPMVTKLSVLPMATMGGGVYGRPQLRLVYTVTFRNNDALLMYPEDDARSKHTVHHYLGLSAEWWFNILHR